jgi:hypothetical protein
LNQQSKEFISALDAELNTIASQIAALSDRQQAISNLRQVYDQPNSQMQAAGFRIGPQSSKSRSYTPQPRPAKPAMSTAARKQIAQTMKKRWQARRAAAAPVTNTKLTEGPAPGGELSSIGMITKVLENAKGTPLSLQEILDEVKKTFGVEPAKTSDQMLWKRANQKKGFYKTEDGKFGLTKHLAEVNKVETTTTAVA